MSDFFTLNHSVKPPKGDCIQCSAVYVCLNFSNTEISLVGLFASRLLLNLYISIGQELLNFFHRLLRRKSSPNIIISQIYQYIIRQFCRIYYYSFLQICMTIEFMTLELEIISYSNISKFYSCCKPFYSIKFNIHSVYTNFL